jgi:hypothetical protein
VRTITSYRLENGQVTKTEYSPHKWHGGYLAESEDIPFHQTVLNAYYKCEQEGKLRHLSPEVKQRVRDIHSQVLEYGDYR